MTTSICVARGITALMGLGAMLFGVLGAAQAAPPAEGETVTIDLPLWVAPVPAEAVAAPACRQLALLRQPRDWRPGDAGVLFAIDRDKPSPARAMLSGAVLAEGAVVLELGIADDCAPDEPAHPQGDAASRLRGGLHALREHAAGLVIVIGENRAAAAVRMIALAARAPAADTPGFALAMGFGSAPAWFLPGMLPDPAEASPGRLRVLCARLGRALNIDAASCDAAAGALRTEQAGLPRPRGP